MRSRPCAFLLLAIQLMTFHSAIAQEPKKHWILGNYHRDFAARLSDDDGVSVLAQEQKLGGVPIVFEAQKVEAQKPPFERSSEPGLALEQGQFMVARGHFVTEQLPSIEYEDNGGAKPTNFKKVMRTYTYFLAEDGFQACPPVSAAFKNDTHELLVTFEAVCLPATLEGVNLSLESSASSLQGASLGKGATQKLVLPLSEIPTSSQWLTVSNIPTSMTIDEKTPAADLAALPEGLISILMRVP